MSKVFVCTKCAIILGGDTYELEPNKRCGLCGGEFRYIDLENEEYEKNTKDDNYLTALHTLCKYNQYVYETFIEPLGTVDKDNEYFKRNYERMYEINGEATQRYDNYIKSMPSQPLANDKTSHKPTCPTCGSTNVAPISGMERGVSILTLGLLSTKINKSYKCSNCKYMW